MFIKTNINWKVDFFLSGIDLGTIPVDISVDISKTSFKVSKQPSTRVHNRRSSSVEKEGC